MKLEEIISKHTAWPAGAHFAYQSAIDNEIYFLNKNAISVVSRTKRTEIPIASKRGRNSIITYKTYTDYINLLAFSEKILESGGITVMKEQYRQRSIQRIENGLRKDFDIDSHELAVEMFNKGWRR